MKSVSSNAKKIIETIWGKGKPYLFFFNIGKKTEPQAQTENIKPEFKSSFKAWIRVVAFIIVAVFLPEQIAQAVEYDWRILWQKPAVNSFYTPAYLKNIHQIDIPLTIKNILKDIANKPVTAIRLSQEITIELEKPLNLTSERIEEIYNWLKGKPCGSKALYEYLAYEGSRVEEQDIAVLALSVDILNGVIKPEGNPKIIKTSLYALSRASEFFGHKLYPVKGLSLEGAVSRVPFIAHLKGEHYVLVSRISDDKVYFIDAHKEEFLPKEKFLERFSGYALVGGAVSLNLLLSDAEAQKVKGGYDSITTGEAGYYEGSSGVTDGYYYLNQGYHYSTNLPSVDASSIKPVWYVPQPVILTSSGMLNCQTGTLAPTMNMLAITPFSNEWQSSTGFSSGVIQVKMSSNLSGESVFVGGGPKFNLPNGQQLAMGWYTNNNVRIPVNNITTQTLTYINNVLTQSAQGNQPAYPTWTKPGEIPTYKYAATMLDAAPGTVVMYMRGSGDSFSVSFPNGAFMRPGDTVYGYNNDYLRGIGSTYENQQRQFTTDPVTKNYEVVVSRGGELLLYQGRLEFLNPYINKYGDFATVTGRGFETRGGDLLHSLGRTDVEIGVRGVTTDGKYGEHHIWKVNDASGYASFKGIDGKPFKMISSSGSGKYSQEFKREGAQLTADGDITDIIFPQGLTVHTILEPLSRGLVFVGEGDTIIPALSEGNVRAGGIQLGFNPKVTNNPTNLTLKFAKLFKNGRLSEEAINVAQGRFPIVIKNENGVLKVGIKESASLAFSEGAKWHNIGQIRKDIKKDKNVDSNITYKDNIGTTDLLITQLSKDDYGNVATNFIGNTLKGADLVFGENGKVASVLGNKSRSAGMLSIIYLNDPYIESQEVKRAYIADPYKSIENTKKQIDVLLKDRTKPEADKKEELQKLQRVLSLCEYLANLKTKDPKSFEDLKGGGKLSSGFDNVATYFEQKRVGSEWKWHAPKGTFKFGNSLQNEEKVGIYAKVNEVKDVKFSDFNSSDFHPTTFQSTEAKQTLTYKAEGNKIKIDDKTFDIKTNLLGPYVKIDEKVYRLRRDKDRDGKDALFLNFTTDYLHYGVKELPVIPDGLIAEKEDNKREGQPYSIERTLTTPRTYKFKNQDKGVVSFEGTDTLVNYGVDSNSGKAFISPITQAANLSWENTRIEDGRTISIGRAVLWQINKDETGNTILSFLGSRNDKPFTFREGTKKGIKIDNAGMLFLTYFFDKPKINSGPSKTSTDPILYTGADRLMTYAINKNGEWVVPEKRYDFDKSLSFKIYQDKNGKGWQEKEVVAQSRRLYDSKSQEGIFHYLVKELDFIEPGKEKNEPKKNAENETIENKDDTKQPKLGDKLDYSKITFLNDKGIITATKDSLMPAIIHLDKQGNLIFNPITLAKGLSYKYKSDGTVYYGNLKLGVPESKEINVKDGKVIIPEGTYGSKEERGELFVKIDVSVDKKGDIKIVSSPSVEDATGKSIIDTMGVWYLDVKRDSNTHKITEVRLWDMRTGKRVELWKSLVSCSAFEEISRIEGEYSQKRMELSEYEKHKEELIKIAEAVNSGKLDLKEAVDEILKQRTIVFAKWLKDVGLPSARRYEDTELRYYLGLQGKGKVKETDVARIAEIIRIDEKVRALAYALPESLIKSARELETYKKEHPIFSFFYPVDYYFNNPNSSLIQAYTFTVGHIVTMPARLAVGGIVKGSEFFGEYVIDRGLVLPLRSVVCGLEATAYMDYALKRYYFGRLMNSPRLIKQAESAIENAKALYSEALLAKANSSIGLIENFVTGGKSNELVFNLVEHLGAINIDKKGSKNWRDWELSGYGLKANEYTAKKLCNLAIDRGTVVDKIRGYAGKVLLTVDEAIALGGITGGVKYVTVKFITMTAVSSLALNIYSEAAYGRPFEGDYVLGGVAGLSPLAAPLTTKLPPALQSILNPQTFGEAAKSAAIWTGVNFVGTKGSNVLLNQEPLIGGWDVNKKYFTQAVFTFTTIFALNSLNIGMNKYYNTSLENKLFVKNPESGEIVGLTSARLPRFQAVGLSTIKGMANLGVVFGNVNMTVDNVLYAPHINEMKFLDTLKFNAKSFAGWEFSDKNGNLITDSSGNLVGRYNLFSGFSGGAIFGGTLGLIGGVANYTNIGQSAFWNKPGIRILNFMYNPAYQGEYQAVSRVVSSITWPLTAVLVRRALDKNMTPKDAIDTAMWAGYARILATPSIRTFFKNGKKVWSVTEQGRLIGDGKALAAWAFKHGVIVTTGAGLNIVKDFGIGLAENKLGLSLGELSYDDKGNLINNGLVWGESTPGQIFVSGLKGAFYGEFLRFMVSSYRGERYLKDVGKHFKNYGSLESQELRIGWFRQRGINIMGDGISQMTAAAVEGAIKWPFVSLVMDKATPVWDTAIGAVEKSIDNKLFRINSGPIWGWEINGKRSPFRVRQEGSNYKSLNFSELLALNPIQYLAAAKHGTYMGIVIKLFSSDPIDSLDPVLGKSIGANMRHIVPKGFWAKLVTLPSKLNSLIDGALNKVIVSGDSLSAFTSGILLEAKSLFFVSGFVTGVDRALQTLNRAGLYTDFLAGKLPIGNFETALAKYNNVAFSGKERSDFGWALLFVRPTYTYDTARLLIEGIKARDGKVTFEAVNKAYKSIRDNEGFVKALTKDAELRILISSQLDTLKINYLKERGLTDKEARWILDRYEKGDTEAIKTFISTKERFIRDRLLVLKDKAAMENLFNQEGFIHNNVKSSRKEQETAELQKRVVRLSSQQEIIKGLEHLKNYSFTGDKEHLQKFIAYSLWLSEGKPKDKADIHWALAGKILSGAINLKEASSGTQERWRRELNYLRKLSQRNNAQNERLTELEAKEKRASDFRNNLISSFNNYKERGLVLTALDSLEHQDIMQAVKSKKEIEPLRTAVEKGIREGVFTLSGAEQEKILKAKDKDIVSIKVQSQTGDVIPLELMVNRDLQIQIAEQFIEPYRSKGYKSDRTEGLLKGIEKLNKHNNELADLMLDRIAERDYILRQSELVLSEGIKISPQEKVYHRANIEYWEAYFKGLNQAKLTALYQARNEALKEANLEILRENLNKISGNETVSLSQAKLFEQAIKKGLYDSLITPEEISSSLPSVLMSGLRNVSARRLQKLIEDARSSSSKLDGEIVGNVDVGIHRIYLTKQNLKELYPELLMLYASSNTEAMLDGTTKNNLIAVYLLNNRNSIGKSIRRHLDKVGSSDPTYKIIKEIESLSNERIFDSTGKALPNYKNKIIGSDGKIDPDKVTAFLMIAGKEFIKRQLEAKKKEFKQPMAINQFRMLLGFLKEKNVSLEASGGKTPIYQLEMLIRALSKAEFKDGKLEYKLNQVLVVRPNEVEQTVTDSKGDINMQEFLGMFGIQKVDGNKYQGDVKQLKEVLNNPSKIVVFDHDVFGHLRNIQDKGLQDILLKQDIVRFDEFHLPYASNTTYLLGKGNIRVSQDIIIMSEDAFVKIKAVLDNNKIKSVRHSEINEHVEEARIYMNEQAKQWSLNDAAITLLRKEVGYREGISTDRIIAAYFDARMADNYQIYNGAILPKDKGTLQENRVFSDSYNLSALYAKEKAKGSKVSPDKLEISGSAYQATLAEVLRFKKETSILGASGTLKDVELLQALHLGKGIEEISQTPFKADTYKNVPSEVVINGAFGFKEKGPMLVFAKDEILLDNLYAKFVGTESNIRLGEKGVEIQAKVTKDSVILRIEANTKESAISAIAREIANGYNGKQIIVLSNPKGATGIDYQGKFRLVLLDGHNWGLSDLLQVISRNRRSGSFGEGERVVFYDKDRLLELTSQTKKELQSIAGEQITKFFGGRDKVTYSEIKDNIDALRILKNATLLDKVEVSNAIIHHTREAAFSRSVIEPLKSMMVVISNKNHKELLERLMTEAIDKEKSINLRAAVYYKDGSQRLEEVLKEVASISYDVFNQISNNKSLPMILRHRASLIRNLATEVLYNYDGIKANGESFHTASNIKDVVSSAKSEEFVRHILPEEVRHSKDISQNNIAVMLINRVNLERELIGEKPLTLQQKTKIYRPLDSVLISNGNRGSPELAGNIAGFLPNSPLKNTLNIIADLKQTISLTTPQQIQQVLGLVNTHIINNTQVPQEKKTEFANFVISVINPNQNYDNLVFANTILTDALKEKIAKDPYLSAEFLNNPLNFTAGMLKPNWLGAWKDKRELNKQSFLLDSIQRFRLENKIALSYKNVLKAYQLDANQFDKYSSRLIHKIEGASVSEAFQFTLLKLANQNLTWDTFQKAKALKREIEKEKDLLDYKVRIGKAAKDLARDSMVQKLRWLDSQIDRLEKEKTEDKNTINDLLITFLREEKANIENKPNKPSRLTLIKYFFVGERVFTMGRLVSAAGDEWGALRLVDKVGKRLDKETAKRISDIVAKIDNKEEKVTVEDLGENKEVAEKIVKLINPFASLSKIKEAKEVVEKYSSILGEEKIKDSLKLSNLLKISNSDIRKVAQDLDKEALIKFLGNLIKTIEEAKYHGSSARDLDRKINEIEKGLREKDKELKKNEKLAKDKKAYLKELEGERYFDSLKGINRQTIEEGLKRTQQDLRNLEDKRKVLVKVIKDLEEEFRKLTEERRDLSFRENEFYANLKISGQDREIVKDNPEKIREVFSLEHLLTSRKEEIISGLVYLGKGYFKLYGLDFNGELFRKLIGDLADNAKAASENLDKIKSETKDDYVRILVEARINMINSYLNGKAIKDVVDNKPVFEYPDYNTRIDTFKSWAKAKEEDLIAELEKDPLKEVIILDTLGKRKVFRDEYEWRSWKLALLKQRRDSDKVSEGDRDKLAADIFFLENLDRIAEEIAQEQMRADLWKDLTETPIDEYNTEWLAKEKEILYDSELFNDYMRRSGAKEKKFKELIVKFAQSSLPLVNDLTSLSFYSRAYGFNTQDIFGNRKNILGRLLAEKVSEEQEKELSAIPMAKFVSMAKAFWETGWQGRVLLADYNFEDFMNLEKEEIKVGDITIKGKPEERTNEVRKSFKEAQETTKSEAKPAKERLVDKAQAYIAKIREGIARYRARNNAEVIKEKINRYKEQLERKQAKIEEIMRKTAYTQNQPLTFQLTQILLRSWYYWTTFDNTRALKTKIEELNTKVIQLTKKDEDLGRLNNLLDNNKNLEDLNATSTLTLIDDTEAIERRNHLPVGIGRDIIKLNDLLRGAMRYSLPIYIEFSSSLNGRMFNRLTNRLIINSKYINDPETLKIIALMGMNGYKSIQDEVDLIVNELYGNGVAIKDTVMRGIVDRLNNGKRKEAIRDIRKLVSVHRNGGRKANNQNNASEEQVPVSPMRQPATPYRDTKSPLAGRASRYLISTIGILIISSIFPKLVHAGEVGVKHLARVNIGNSIGARSPGIEDVAAFCANAGHVMNISAQNIGLIIATAVIAIIAIIVVRALRYGAVVKTEGAQSVKKGQDAEGADSGKGIGGWASVGRVYNIGKRWLHNLAGKILAKIQNAYNKLLTNDLPHVKLAIKERLSKLFGPKKTEDKDTEATLQNIIKEKEKVSPRFENLLRVLIKVGMKEETLKRIVEIRRELVKKISEEVAKSRAGKDLDNWIWAELEVDDFIIHNLAYLEGAEDKKMMNILKLKAETFLAEIDASENTDLKTKLIDGLNQIFRFIKEGLKGLSAKERKKFIQELGSSIKQGGEKKTENDIPPGLIMIGGELFSQSKMRMLIDKEMDRLRQLKEYRDVDDVTLEDIAIDNLDKQGKLKEFENCFITSIQNKELRMRVAEEVRRLEKDGRELNWYLLEKIYNNSLAKMVKEGKISKERAGKLGPLRLFKTTPQELEEILRKEADVTNLRILYPTKEGRNHAIRIRRVRIDNKGKVHIEITEENVNGEGVKREVELSEFAKELGEIRIIAPEKYGKIFKREVSVREKKTIKRPYYRSGSTSSTQNQTTSQENRNNQDNNLSNADKTSGGEGRGGRPVSGGEIIIIFGGNNTGGGKGFGGGFIIIIGGSEGFGQGQSPAGTTPGLGNGNSPFGTIDIPGFGRISFFGDANARDILEIINNILNQNKEKALPLGKKVAYVGGGKDVVVILGKEALARLETAGAIKLGARGNRREYERGGINIRGPPAKELYAYVITSQNNSYLVVIDVALKTVGIQVYRIATGTQAQSNLETLETLLNIKYSTSQLTAIRITFNNSNDTDFALKEVLYIRETADEIVVRVAGAEANIPVTARDVKNKGANKTLLAIVNNIGKGVFGVKGANSAEAVVVMANLGAVAEALKANSEVRLVTVSRDTLMVVIPAINHIASVKNQGQSLSLRSGTVPAVVIFTINTREAPASVESGYDRESASEREGTANTGLPLTAENAFLFNILVTIQAALRALLAKGKLSEGLVAKLRALSSGIDKAIKGAFNEYAMQQAGLRDANRANAPPWISDIVVIGVILTKGGENDVTIIRIQGRGEKLRITIRYHETGRVKPERRDELLRADRDAEANKGKRSLSGRIKVIKLFVNRAETYLKNGLYRLYSGIIEALERLTRSPPWARVACVVILIAAILAFFPAVAEAAELIQKQAYNLKDLLLTQPYTLPSVAGIRVAAIVVIGVLVGALLYLQGLTPPAEGSITTKGGASWSRLHTND
jgi:hypothetical protein